MNKIILSFLLSIGTFVNASENSSWLGIFTTDNYPVAGCSTTKIGSYIQHSSSGYEFQPQDLNSENSYLNAIQEGEYANQLILAASKKGFNAILGFQFDVFGGFDTYNGSVTNGKMGIGLFRVVARGTPVKITCK